MFLGVRRLAITDSNDASVARQRRVPSFKELSIPAMSTGPFTGTLIPRTLHLNDWFECGTPRSDANPATPVSSIILYLSVI